MRNTAVPLRSLHSAMVIAAASIGAVFLGWQSIQVNLAQCQVTQDTPYFDICPRPAMDTEARIAALRERISANPGDANAYVQLAATDGAAPGFLAAAQRLAPSTPVVLKRQAVAALEKQDLPNAITPLLQLTEYYNDTQAAVVLARLVGAGHGLALTGHLLPGSHWLERVLVQMPHSKVPFSTALPLVVQAFRAHVIDEATVRGYIRELKAGASWADAYSLWLSLQGKPLPILFNGGFDEPFDADGFDWEVTPASSVGKEGAIVERRGEDQRGAVLDIRFTGRALAVPVMRQPLFISPGRYRLRGDYLARQLRMEQGLAWRIVCAASPSLASRSPPLTDTAGTWRSFAFEFSVPPDCGLVATLQLETFAPFESALGARGRVLFDAFSLEKLGS